MDSTALAAIYLSIYLLIEKTTILYLSNWQICLLSTLLIITIIITKQVLDIKISHSILLYFIIGTLLSIISSLFFFTKNSIILLCSIILFGCSIGMILSASAYFNKDFLYINSLYHSDLKEPKDNLSSKLCYYFPSILCLSFFFFFIIKPVNIFAIGVPICILCMSTAFVLALKQPLDKKTRQKLYFYSKTTILNSSIKESIKNRLVENYDVHYGVKILCILLRPFLRFKIRGEKNLKKENSPAIFVCNHDHINGPIYSVTYLNTFFKIWIHDEMLVYTSTLKNLTYSLRFLTKYFGNKLGAKLIVLASKFVCWGLNSFEPIPVRRGPSREISKTFILSLKALEEGDNILLFPEKPGNGEIRKNKNESTAPRKFYTGFAHLGKLYYDKFGKRISFYPLFVNTNKRILHIGKPIQYDPQFDTIKSKESLANILYQQMKDLEFE